jgi:hypothetical protein
MSALFFLFVAIVAGAISLTPIIMRGEIPMSGGMLLAYAITIISAIAAVLYGSYREEVTFDFGSKTYRIKKGFFWKRREIHGTFEEIEAVEVQEGRMSSGGRVAGHNTGSHISYNIWIECRRESPTFGIWQAQTREQAEYVSRELASAFGCEVRHKNGDRFIFARRN